MRELKQEQEGLLALLYPLEPPERSRKRFQQKRKKQALLAVALVLVFGAGMVLKNKQGVLLQEGNRLERPQSGTQEYELVAGADTQAKEVLVEVTARRLTGEELEALYRLAFDELRQRICGKNKSLAEVQYSLDLVSSLPEYGMEIEWDTSATPYIRADGMVKNTVLTEPKEASITATLYYGEETREQSFILNILPYPYSEAEVFASELAKAVEQANEESALLQYQQLPEEINGRKLQWSEKKENHYGLLLILGIVIVLLVYYQAGAALKQKSKKREEQLLMDYPVLLGRMMLLLEAGLTVKRAWERIAEDYRKSRKRRYVYEEMLRTLSQMELGVPEWKAYEEFGVRCGLLPYLRFTTLLVQNLKKGSKRLLELLQMESQEAFSERKEQARRKGEEAGTKLLLPMGGMLLIVLVIVLVPAFASFQI